MCLRTFGLLLLLLLILTLAPNKLISDYYFLNLLEKERGPATYQIWTIKRLLPRPLRG